MICLVGLAQGNIDAKRQGVIITLDGPTKNLGNPIFFIIADSLTTTFERSELLGDSTRIDPNWIQSIKVMKHEEATQKYGIRGEFGVVIIELKKGALDSMPRALRARFGFIRE